MVLSRVKRGVRQPANTLNLAQGDQADPVSRVKRDSTAVFGPV